MATTKRLGRDLIFGSDNRIELSVRGKTAYAVRTDGWWSIEPASLAVSKANSWRNLRDLRSAVRAANAKG
jgi:uncharacterized membrane protein